jgi:hypothetical protein
MAGGHERSLSTSGRGRRGRVPSFICRRTPAERLVHGVPLDPNTLDQVRGAGCAVGQADAEIERAIMPTEATRES